MKIFAAIIILLGIGYGVYSYTQKSTSKDAEFVQSEQMVKEENDNTGENVSLVMGSKQIDTEKSIFTWTAKKQVIKTWIDTGTVKASSGSVMFENGSVKNGEVIIDMNSITTKTTGSGSGQDKLTTHVKSPDFFDVAKYPVAKINITKVENDTAYGELTIKEIKKPVTFPIKISGQSITGTLAIDRSMFDVKFGSDKFFQNLGDKAIDNIFTIDFNLQTK